VNNLLISIISLENYTNLRHSITSNIALPDFIIYSLPEGLWVFSVTLISKDLFLKIGRVTILLLYVPLLFSIGLEFLQYFHVTNGRFDFWDILVSVFFWFIASYLVSHENKKKDILHPFSIHSSLCVLSYLIVYLSYHKVS